jgi:hypothetical protein
MIRTFRKEVSMKLPAALTIALAAMALPATAAFAGPFSALIARTSGSGHRGPDWVNDGANAEAAAAPLTATCAQFIAASQEGQTQIVSYLAGYEQWAKGVNDGLSQVSVASVLTQCRVDDGQMVSVIVGKLVG